MSSITGSFEMMGRMRNDGWNWSDGARRVRGCHRGDDLSWIDDHDGEKLERRTRVRVEASKQRGMEGEMKQLSFVRSGMIVGEMGEEKRWERERYCNTRQSWRVERYENQTTRALMARKEALSLLQPQSVQRHRFADQSTPPASRKRAPISWHGGGETLRPPLAASAPGVPSSFYQPFHDFHPSPHSSSPNRHSRSAAELVPCLGLPSSFRRVAACST